MSVGMILLTVVAILVFFGVAQRVLDRMRLSDRMALLLIAAMFFGTLLPNITLGPVAFSIGGALIPLGVCVYLLVRAGSGKEKARALIGSLVTGGIVFVLSRFLPAEPEALPIDPLYLYGIAGGVVAWLLGRSRRSAFICGVLGIFWSDIATAIINWSTGIDQQLVLGGAGVFDAMVVSGILGVVLCELIGEIAERMSRGKNPPKDSKIVNPVREKEGGK